MRSFVRFFLLALCVTAAFAADATGKWIATFEAPDGQKRQATMNLKAEGPALTGTVSGMSGDVPIQGGKVDGDTITFHIVRSRDGQEFKIEYKGVITGDDMKMTVSFGGDRSFDVTAKREK